MDQHRVQSILLESITSKIRSMAPYRLLVQHTINFKFSTFMRSAYQLTENLQIPFDKLIIISVQVSWVHRYGFIQIQKLRRFRIGSIEVLIVKSSSIPCTTNWHTLWCMMDIGREILASVTMPHLIYWMGTIDKSRCCHRGSGNKKPIGIILEDLKGYRTAYI